MTLRALIVDDNVEFLNAARALLEREGVDVPALASTSAEALEQVDRLRPDVALVDIDLGAESGFDLAERLAGGTAGGHRPRIVLISTYAERDVAELVDATPAIGFLSKSDISGAALRELLATASGEEP
ncbi:MAG: response regulator containing a CheY-like receiver domain and an DNA-binding domain [Acidimicrobiales bacterium]|nr:response regulator containing a CheY-like receiver domain and an DNA-binding domain [Acidimicrobiales bacterium]